MTLLAFLLAAQVDGQAALRHASALASLGPHPWGSPRSRAAAEYVAAQFRTAGLADVRLEDFESHGVRGANVVGVLRGRGPLRSSWSWAPITTRRRRRPAPTTTGAVWAS